MNTIQMGIITGGPFDTFDPIVRVINYPFMFQDNAQADEVLDGPLGLEILESLETSGFKGLCFSENGFRNLTNSKLPVKKPDDIKGLKIRVMSSTSQSHLAGSGSQSDPHALADLHGTRTRRYRRPGKSLWVMEVYKLYEIQKYMTLTRHVYSPHIDVASLKWWKTLDANTQELIQRTIHEAAVFQRNDNRSKNAARLALLKGKRDEDRSASGYRCLSCQSGRIQSTDLYSEPRVQAMLIEMLNSTK